MAISQYYVDYGAGNDTTGDGSIGTPWKTIQKALDTITRNSTDGDQVNVKAGTAQELAAILSFASYGSTASADAPLVLRGYTSAANDGGVATIDAGGNKIIEQDAFAHLVCRDLICTNSGSNAMLRTGGYLIVIRCQFTNLTGRAIWNIGTAGPFILGCYVATTSGAALTIGLGAYVSRCYLAGGTILTASGPAGVIDGNIIVPTDNNNGITVSENAPVITNNIIRAPGASTGAGVSIGANSEHGIIANNLITGFSGAGGAGVRVASGGLLVSTANNAYYNNTANVANSGVLLQDDGGDVALAADPFADAANGDFSLTPAAQAALRSAGWPSSYLGAHANTDPHITIGALQYGPTPAASGGGGRRRRLWTFGG